MIPRSSTLDRLETGDVLTLWKLDRLGRNARQVLDLIEDSRERGAGFRSLTEGLDTAGPVGSAMLTVVVAFVQLERDTIIERTKSRPRCGGGQQPPRRKTPQSR